LEQLMLMVTGVVVVIGKLAVAAELVVRLQTHNHL
jgi:hypothetical protein